MPEREDGDTRNLEDLLASFAPRVFGLLVRIVGNRSTAEDLTQETMLRAFRGLPSYRPEGKFDAWIFRIAVNLARDWIRRRPMEPSVGLDETLDASGPRDPSVEASPDASLERRERAARVEAAIARLSPADREVILLRYYADMAFKDIAKTTGEPLGTVLARAHRALAKLGNLMPEDGP
jgi:RNA polymerase sigma-70 factor (ECF subfamily)